MKKILGIILALLLATQVWAGPISPGGGTINPNIVASLGTELITSPMVAGGWTLETDTGGWGITAGVLSKTANATLTLTATAVAGMTAAPVAGTTYKVTIVCSAVNGTLIYTLGGVTGTTITATTVTDYITASTTDKIIFAGANTVTATITSVSVKALTDATGDLTVDGNLTVRSPATLTSLTASKPVFTNASKALVSVGTLGVDQGGTGLATITDHGIMLGSGASAVTPMAILDTGQMVVGVTGADPTTVAANITTTKKFLAETGTGTAGATPVFDTIISGDLTTALTTPPAIGDTTPAYGRFSPGVSKGPAIINAPAGTVTTGGASSTTLTFSTTALAAQAGYSATAPVVGTTLIVAGPFTRYVVSWTNSTTCVLDSVVTLTDAAVTSIHLPIATFVDSSGAVKGWVNAAGVISFLANINIGISGATPNLQMTNVAGLINAVQWQGGEILSIYNGLLNIKQASNVGIGTSTWGTSAAKVLAMGSGTAPTTSPADAAQIWVADTGAVAGKAAFQMRDEVGNSGPVAFAKIPEYVEAATDTLTIDQVYGGLINNYGQADDAVLTLPACTAGMNFTVILGTTVAKYFRLDPNASDAIYLDGVVDTDGHYVGVASAAAGNAIQFVAFQTGASAWDWMATTVSGSWVAE
ncbi:MAG: hypothetical protein V1736_05860 [Pseudomonadota bacterium]